MLTPGITAAILTHDESDMIAGCIQTLQWCERVLVLDQHSADGTAKIALQLGATVGMSDTTSFAQRRNELLEACATEWILYIDADERVTPELANAIRDVVTQNSATAASFPRTNFFFGAEFRHGGWQGERVTRLFRVDALQGWQGRIHESPKYTGEVLELTAPLWHFSHRSVSDGLMKTANWTPMEADLLAQATEKPVSFWVIVRKGLGEAWRRGIRHSAWKDGEAGLIEMLTQVINRMLVYMQVWERQQKPPIATRYQELQQQIDALWQKNA